MKKILFAVVIAVGVLGAAAPAFADDHYRRPMVKHPHHRVICHNVHYHGHWVKRCR